MTQPLDWNSAGDHAYPCMFSLPGSYPTGTVHCSCDLPDRIYEAWMAGTPVSSWDLKNSTAERSRRREIIDKAINETIDSFTHTRR